MAREVDGVKYRTSVLKILETKNDAFCKLYRKFAKAAGHGEALDFLVETEKQEPKKHFPIYFAPKPKKNLKSIKPVLRNQADTLATVDDWKDKKWAEIYSQARDAVVKDTEKELTDKFFASDFFKAVHQRYLNKKKEKAAAESKKMRQGVRFTKSPVE